MSIARFLIVSALPLLLSAPAPAQGLTNIGQVEGYVDGPDGKSVAGAVVNFDRIDYTLHAEVKTDKSGYWQILTVPEGDYVLTVTVNGQVRYKDDLFHVSSGRQQDVAGHMSAIVFKLKPPDVAAEEAKQEEATRVQEMSKAEAEKRSKAQQEMQQKSAALTKGFSDGQAALAAKQYDAAIESLTKVSEADPKQSATWSALADAYMGLGRQKPADAATDYQQALNAFNQAIALAPANAGYYNNWALTLAASNRMDEAKAALAKAVELDPAGVGKYYYNLGTLLLNSGKSDEATEQFKRAIDADPKYAEAQYQYGVSLLAKATTDASGKIVAPAEAVEALQKYLQLAPNGPNAQSAKDVLSSLGK